MKVKYTLIDSGKPEEYVDDSFYGVSKALCFCDLCNDIKVSNIKVIDDNGNEREVIYDEKPNCEFTFTYVDNGTKAGEYFGPSEWNQIRYFL